MSPQQQGVPKMNLYLIMLNLFLEAVLSMHHGYGDYVPFQRSGYTTREV